IASETCAFDLIDAKYVRDVEPGEMIVINDEGLRSSHPLPPQRHSMCIFEHVYFSRPDSIIFGQSVNRSRHRMGRRLRIEQLADAIARGTTAKKIVRMVREAGDSKIHVRISCPPTVGPCYYGVDTPNKAELIAANMSVEEIRDFIEADSLGYLSLDGMLEATGLNPDEACVACWNERYPKRTTLEAETKK